MNKTRVAIGGLAAASLIALGVAVAQGGAASPAEPKVDEENAVAKFVASCRSEMAGGGTIDLARIGSKESAEKSTLPTTPDEAAQDGLDSDTFFPFETYGELTLNRGEPLETTEEDVLPKYEYFATNKAGETVARLVITNLGFDHFAMTGITRCAI